MKKKTVPLQICNPKPHTGGWPAIAGPKRPQPPAIRQRSARRPRDSLESHAAGVRQLNLRGSQAAQALRPRSYAPLPARLPALRQESLGGKRHRIKKDSPPASRTLSAAAAALASLTTPPCCSTCSRSAASCSGDSRGSFCSSSTLFSRVVTWGGGKQETTWAGSCFNYSAA